MRDTPVAKNSARPLCLKLLITHECNSIPDSLSSHALQAAFSPRPSQRSTETTFIELLRHQIIAAAPGAAGWLAALADPALGRCLALIHDDPARGWSVSALAAASGLSRSTLTERFETVLDTSPMRYVRDWRLCLASVALTTTAKASRRSRMTRATAPRPPSIAHSHAPTAPRRPHGGRTRSAARRVPQKRGEPSHLSRSGRGS